MKCEFFILVYDFICVIKIIKVGNKQYGDA
jgi:hypothetical protein